MPKQQVLTRNELYNKVWEKPMVQLAKEFGISDRGLAKICKKYDIPRPGLGYWAKLEFGKKVEKVPLPKNRELDKKSITINPFSIAVLSQQSNRKSVYVKSPIPITTDITEKLHPVVAKALKKLLRPGKKVGFFDHRKTCFDISVSDSNIQRAMMVIDTIIKALENRGHQFKVTQEERDGYGGEKIKIEHCNFEIKGEKVSFSISEKLNGSLRFIVPNASYQKYSWTETKTKKIEDKVPQIIQGILKAANSFKKRRIEAKHREIREAKERQKAWEREVRMRKEREEIDNLMSQVDNWNKARSIRSYLRAVERFVIQKRGGYDKGSEIDQWLTWAYDFAKKIDPLTL